jgi:ACT domain-containing protein
MAKGKYTPEKVETILEVLRATGSDKAVILDPEIGISRDTFYKWLKKYPDFSDQVAQAKKHYRITQPKWQRYQANQVLAKYLTEGAIETWQSEEIAYDAEGNVTGRKVITKTVKRSAPQWAIERVLGKRLDELDAMLTLMECQMIEPDDVNILHTDSVAHQE